MEVPEDVLPRLSKAKKSRRKSDAAHSKVMSECEERHSCLVHHPRPVPLEKSSEVRLNGAGRVQGRVVELRTRRLISLLEYLDASLLLHLRLRQHPKYFDSASAQVTSPAVPVCDLLTDPKSITLATRLASTKPSRTVGSPVGMAFNSTSAKWSPASGSRIVPQEKYEALDADFMIMLGKLKPILVQGKFNSSAML